jgi:hypothetical protein
MPDEDGLIRLPDAPGLGMTVRHATKRGGGRAGESSGRWARVSAPRRERPPATFLGESLTASATIRTPRAPGRLRSAPGRARCRGRSHRSCA